MGWSRMLRRWSCCASRFAPCLVRTNTSTWRQSLDLTRCASRWRFWSACTGYTTCATSSAGVLRRATSTVIGFRSEEHTSELQSQSNLVCRLLLEKKKKNMYTPLPPLSVYQGAVSSFTSCLSVYCYIERESLRLLPVDFASTPTAVISPTTTSLSL